MQSAKSQQEVEDSVPKQCQKQNRQLVQKTHNDNKPEILSLIPVDIKQKQQNNVNNETLNLIQDKKKQGNQRYKQKKYDSAIRQYQNALTIMGNVDFAKISQEDKIKFKDKVCVLLCNIGLCYYATKQLLKAQTFFSQSIKTNDKHIKAIYKRAVTRFELKKYDQAWEDIKIAKKLDQNNEDIQELWEKIKRTRSKNDEQNKQMFQKMFSNSPKINSANQASEWNGARSERSDKSIMNQGSITKQVDIINQRNTKKQKSLFSKSNITTACVMIGAVALVGFGFFKKFVK